MEALLQESHMALLLHGGVQRLRRIECLCMLHSARQSMTSYCQTGNKGDAKWSCGQGIYLGDRSPERTDYDNILLCCSTTLIGSRVAC